MRLALIIALTPDRRTIGRVLSPLLTATDAMSQLKEAVTSGRCPDPRFPIVQAVALDSVIKEHRFRPTTGDIAQAIDAANRAAAPAQDDELQKQIADLASKLEDANKGLSQADELIATKGTELQTANTRIAELESQLAEAAKNKSRK
jgi:hypothetical protein